MASILNLGPRLETIVDLCDNVKVSADIGCDHGYVASELILQYKSNKVIATDISKSSLNKAIRFCESINISAFVSFRDGDGFSGVTKHDKVKQAIIAGMGGYEIINIMKNCKLKIKKFVLQPMRDAVALREYVINNGFKILTDIIVYDTDRYYTIIKIQKGRQKPLNELQFYFGKDNFDLRNTTFIEYLTFERNKLIKIKKDVGELNEQYSQKFYYIEKAFEAFQLKKEKFLKLSQSKQSDPISSKIFKRNGKI